MCSLESLYDLCPAASFPPAIPVPRGSHEYMVGESAGIKEYPICFRFFCLLWTIVSEIVCTYRAWRGGLDELLVFAIAKHRTLLALTAQLPDFATRDERNLPCVAVFQ